FMYLLSHERATGRPHPMRERQNTAATLRFPLVFSPNGVPCSFGDVNHFAPLPSHFAAAERFGQAAITDELDRRLWDPALRVPLGRLPCPLDADLLLLLPRQPRDACEESWRALSLQARLEWGSVADRMPDPVLYVSLRGAPVDAPRLHQDLFSYHCPV